MKLASLSLLAVVAALAAPGCGDDGSSPTTSSTSSASSGAGGAGGAVPASGIHVVNGALGEGEAELCVNGMPTGARAKPGEASPIVPFDFGTYIVTVDPSGTGCAEKVPGPFGGNAFANLDDATPKALVLFYGVKGTSSPLAVWSFETTDEPMPGRLSLRLINAAPGFASLDLGSIDGGNWDPLNTDAKFGAEGETLPGLAGYVDLGIPPSVLAVRKSGETTDLVETIPLSLEGDRTYSVIATAPDDTASAPPTLFLCEDTPAPSCIEVSP
jgi:hypothetical protein